jgi:hypothetical protein
MQSYGKLPYTSRRKFFKSRPEIGGLLIVTEKTPGDLNPFVHIVHYEGPACRALAPLAESVLPWDGYQAKR